MSILDINDTPLEFGWKQSNLKFWLLRPGAQGSNCHIRTMNWFSRNIIMDLLNLDSLFIIYLMWQKKLEIISKMKQIKFSAKFA